MSHYLGRKQIRCFSNFNRVSSALLSPLECSKTVLELTHLNLSLETKFSVGKETELNLILFLQIALKMRHKLQLKRKGKTM